MTYCGTISSLTNRQPSFNTQQTNKYNRHNTKLFTEVSPFSNCMLKKLRSLYELFVYIKEERMQMFPVHDNTNRNLHYVVPKNYHSSQ